MKTLKRLKSDRPRVSLAWPKTVNEGESLWSIVHKLCRCNHVGGRAVERLFSTAKRSKVSREIAKRAAFIDLRHSTSLDFNQLFAAAGVCPSLLESSTLDRIIGGHPGLVSVFSWDHLHFCPACIRAGYHSPVFQLKGVEECPFHRIALLRKCPHCGRHLSLCAPVLPDLALCCGWCRMALVEEGSGLPERGHVLFNALLNSTRRAFERFREGETWVYGKEYDCINFRRLDRCSWRHPDIFRYFCQAYPELASEGLAFSFRSAPLATVTMTEVRADDSEGARTRAVLQEVIRKLYLRIRRRLIKKVSRWGKNSENWAAVSGGLDVPARRSREANELRTIWLWRAFFEGRNRWTGPATRASMQFGFDSGIPMDVFQTTVRSAYLDSETVPAKVALWSDSHAFASLCREIWQAASDFAVNNDAFLSKMHIQFLVPQLRSRVFIRATKSHARLCVYAIT